MLLAEDPSIVALALAAASAQRAAAACAGDLLALVQGRLPIRRRLMHAGDALYRTGERFVHLVLLNAGSCKLVSPSADGWDQVVGWQFRGDCFGFDGIASGNHDCDAIALDTGEVWTLRYDQVLPACAAHQPMMAALQVEMSRSILRGRAAMRSRCTLPVAARVAEFLGWWADSLHRRGQRTDRITLPMTRGEIGNYLGMTLESVSRALSALARNGVIAFADKGRREILIPDLPALAAHVQGLLPSSRNCCGRTPSTRSELSSAGTLRSTGNALQCRS